MSSTKMKDHTATNTNVSNYFYQKGANTISQSSSLNAQHLKEKLTSLPTKI